MDNTRKQRRSGQTFAKCDNKTNKKLSQQGLREVYEGKLNTMVDMYFEKHIDSPDSEDENKKVYDELNSMWKKEARTANTFHKKLKLNFNAFEAFVGHMLGEIDKEKRLAAGV